MDASPTPQPRWFYGWNIVVAGVLCQFFSVGLAFYSFGVFLDPLIAEFGWTKADTSLGFSCYTIATAVGNVLFGRLLARGSARKLTIVGSLLVGAGLALMGTVHSLPQLYLYMGALIGLGVVAVGGITSATLINHWFLMRRAMAISIASAGVSAGGLLSTPLIERLIHAVGWRNAYFALGAAEVAVILPIAIFLLRDTPEEMGLHPDGVRPARPRDANGPADPNERVWTYRETLTNRSFYLLLLSFTLNLGSLTAVIVHMVSDVTAKGFGRPAAAFAYSICAGVGLFAKPAFGWFGDRFPKRAGAAA
ncbi:MAG: MFS transporter, partial [Candidatus Methylomirabilis sp.]|nr:MFS transporter [Deltaproteobacteria bacterium]